MSFFVESDDFLIAADEFIAKFTDDKRLRSVLAYMNPLYGGKANTSPTCWLILSNNMGATSLPMMVWNG